MFQVLFTKYRNFILYGIIGGFSAALDFGVYTVLGEFIPILWANVISVHCGIICSFICNRSFNFKVKNNVGIRFLSFYLVGLSGLGLSELLIYVFAERNGLNHLVVKLVTVFIVAVYQFLLNKFITFKTKTNG